MPMPLPNAHRTIFSQIIFFSITLRKPSIRSPVNNDVIRARAQEPDISPRFFSSVISRIVTNKATTNPTQPVFNTSLIFSFIIFKF